MLQSDEQYVVNTTGKQLRWSRCSMLALGTQVGWFKPVGFLGWKNPQHAILRKGSTAMGPMS